MGEGKENGLSVQNRSSIELHKLEISVSPLGILLVRGMLRDPCL